MKKPKAVKRNYCIQTLTHDYQEAGVLLQLVVDQFIKNTDITSSTDTKLDWFIRCNGINEELQATLDSLPKKYSDVINWYIHIGDNIGTGAGINFLNEKCISYEYALFIEGDWICLDTEVSGASRSWLKDSITILDKNPEISQVFLRRHTSDTEDRQYGMSHWFDSKYDITEEFEGNTTFLRLSKGRYTNNPTLKRQKNYYDVGIFPLTEYYDKAGNPTEIKVYTTDKSQPHVSWGQAEIEAFPKGALLKNYWLWPGNFNHIHNLELKDFNAPCHPCKYGFFTPSSWFCLSCTSNQGYFQLAEHTNKGLLEVLDNLCYNKEGKLEMEPTVNLVKSVIKNPTTPPKTLIKFFNKS